MNVKTIMQFKMYMNTLNTIQTITIFDKNLTDYSGWAFQEWNIQYWNGI